MRSLARSATRPVLHLKSHLPISQRSRRVRPPTPPTLRPPRLRPNTLQTTPAPPRPLWRIFLRQASSLPAVSPTPPRTIATSTTPRRSTSARASASPIFHDKLVFRGGFGIFVNPFNDYNTQQTYGYSQTSTYTPQTTVAVPTITLSDPFNAATSPILQPTGSSLGVNTNLGAGVQFRGPNLHVPYAERFNFDIQRSIGAHILVDVAYLGAHQVHLSYSNTYSSVPLLPYLSRSFRADPVVSGALGASVPNPFLGAPNVTGTLATAATTTVYQLLQANPEYTAVTQALVPGASATFNQLMARFYVRQAYGMTLNVNYEYSRNLITGQLTPGGPLTYGESTSDYPHHVSVTGTYALPIGHGKKFLNHGGVLDALIGGFQLNSIYQMLSGTPISWGAVGFANNTARFQSNFQRNPRNYERALNTDVFYKGTGTGYKACTTPSTTVACDLSDTGQASGTYNFRQFPQYFLRSDFTNNLDASIIKSFRIAERYRIEYRFEAFNILNHTQFGSPNVSPTSAVSQTSSGPSGFGTINTILKRESHPATGPAHLLLTPNLPQPGAPCSQFRRDHGVSR